MDFNEIFWENVTCDDDKTFHSLQMVYFLKYILRVKEWIFLNETSILVFAEPAKNKYKLLSKI